MEVNSEIYSTEPRSGEVNIFHLAPTLRGIIVLVFAQSLNIHMENLSLRCSRIMKNASYLKKARAPSCMIVKM